MQRMDGLREPRRDWKGSKGGRLAKFGSSMLLNPLPEGPAAIDDRFPLLCSASKGLFVPSPPSAGRYVALAFADWGGVPNAPLLMLSPLMVWLMAWLLLSYAADV